MLYYALFSSLFFEKSLLLSSNSDSAVFNNKPVPRPLLKDKDDIGKQRYQIHSYHLLIFTIYHETMSIDAYFTNYFTSYFVLPPQSHVFTQSCQYYHNWLPGKTRLWLIMCLMLNSTQFSPNHFHPLLKHDHAISAYYVKLSADVISKQHSLLNSFTQHIHVIILISALKAFQSFYYGHEV